MARLVCRVVFPQSPGSFAAMQHKMSQPFGLGAFIEISGRFWILVGIEICSGNAADLRFIARARLGSGLGFVSEFGWVYYHPDGLIDPFNRLSSAIPLGIVFGRAKLNCVATLNRVRRGLSTVGAGSV